MNPTLIVFARAPVAGRCKTRLIPRLGAAGAADLYARLLQTTLSRAEMLSGWKLRLQALDEDARAFFLDALDPRCWRVLLQQGPDLGVRMVSALNEAVAEGAPALLMGSDILDWTLDDLEQAASALMDGCDIALAPAYDGGFWLLGAHAPLPESVFAGLPWGTASVCAEARRRLTGAGLRCRLFNTRHDIDVPEDLERHAECLARLRVADHWAGNSSASGARPESSGAAPSRSGSVGSN